MVVLLGNSQDLLPGSDCDQLNHTKDKTELVLILDMKEELSLSSRPGPAVWELRAQHTMSSFIFLDIEISSKDHQYLDFQFSIISRTIQVSLVM